MTQQLTFRRSTQRILDDLLDFENMEYAFAVGSYRETGKLAKLDRSSLAAILNDARIKYPDNKETAILLARYVVQAEYQRRNGQHEKSAATLSNLFGHMKLRNLQYVTEDSYQEFSESEEETMSADETNNTTAEETPKAAGSKAAKKGKAKKAAAPKKAAKKASGKSKDQRKKEAEERKSRLENQIVHLKKMPSEDQLPTQAYQICKVLKSKGGKMIAKTLVANLEGVVQTKQSLMAIWSFYRARLLNEGFVTIEDARE